MLGPALFRHHALVYLAVLLVPLAGLIFLAAGRHPVLGLAAAFAGVSGGYSANLVLGILRLKEGSGTPLSVMAFVP